MKRAARSIATRLAWLGCALLVALGAAGIVAGMEHQPGTAARAELTWAADRRISPGLDAAAGALRALISDVDALGTIGTNTLVAVTGGDAAAIQRGIANGRSLIDRIDAETTALRARLAALPGVGPGAQGRLGGLALLRYQTLSGALDATGVLGTSWDRLTAGSLAAVQLQTTLAEHDAATLAAARLGSAGRYTAAVAAFAGSDAALAAARTQRDAMSAAVDVSVLTSWIDRSAAYDAALKRLYQLLASSKGRVTTAVRAAFAAEEAAKAQLPHDTRALIVIMAEIAQGGLNQAVISIEDAKGRLGDALDAFILAGLGSHGGSGPTAPAGSSPAPSASPAT
ncbi:MAG: hypothetical protein ACYDCI_12505 [Candidatus Limnocylindrales bacterium]